MSTTPLCSDREEPRESKADGGSSVKPSRCYSVNSVGKDETSWIDGILSLDLAESIPVVGVSIAAITICTTFTLFFATGKTTESVCEEGKMGHCDSIKDWQLIPTLSFTFVPWPGYIVSLFGMLTACILFFVSGEMENRILYLQMRRLNLLGRQRIRGWCCCCFSVSFILSTARLVSTIVCICLATCICCQLRFNVSVHSTAAFFLFIGGLLMVLLQQQIQSTILKCSNERDHEALLEWWQEAEKAMRFKRWALLAYLLCFIGYSIAVVIRRHAVEPYSAALEYVVVIALAIGLTTYTADIRIHKVHFGTCESRLMVIENVTS